MKYIGGLSAGPPGDIDYKKSVSHAETRCEVCLDGLCGQSKIPAEAIFSRDLDELSSDDNRTPTIVV